MNRLQCELLFNFSLFLYRWEEISKSLFLGIFVPRISPVFFVGIQFFSQSSPFDFFFPDPKNPILSLLFFYLNERVSWETFRVLPSLMMISPAILLLRCLWPSVVLSHPWDESPDF